MDVGYSVWPLESIVANSILISIFHRDRVKLDCSNQSEFLVLLPSGKATRCLRVKEGSSPFRIAILFRSSSVGRTQVSET